MNKIKTFVILVICIIIIICFLLNYNVNTKEENFTSRNLANEIDTIFFTHIDYLNNRFLDSEGKSEINETQSEGEANKIITNIINNIHESKINEINIKSDTTDFGKKCMNNKVCEKSEKDNKYKCFVKVQNKDFKVGRKIIKQSCDKLLNNTQNHKVNMNGFKLDNKESLKNLLIKIERVYNTYNDKLNVLLNNLENKENNIRQQIYFENNSVNMLDTNRDKNNMLQESLNEKNFNSNKNFIILRENKDKLSEYQKINTNYMIILRILLFIYAIIILLKLLKKDIIY